MPPDSPVLAFDTSAAHCAAALLCGANIVTSRVESMTKGQAERLFPLLEEVLAEACLSWRDLAAIGVGIGPGNFTGIRIAVSAARGLALSLDIPAVGVSTLEAMAFGQPGSVVSLIDARRDLFYVQGFGGAPFAEPTLMPRGALLGGLADAADVVCIGFDAPDIAAQVGAGWTDPQLPLAQAIARIAARRRAVPDLPRPAPLYLRPADAAPPSDPAPVLLDE